jgi:hypothetical protein
MYLYENKKPMPAGGSFGSNDAFINVKSIVGYIK